MLIFKNTCGILTLQIGLVSLASLYITLAVCIILANTLSIKKEELLAWIVMFSFTFMMSVIWLIIFIGAYKESYNIISVATILWTIYLVLWTVLITWSFLEYKKEICIESRCPSVLWLINNSHYESKDCEQLNNNIKQPIMDMQLNHDKTNLFNVIPKDFLKNQGSLISSIVLLIFYAQILLYSWMVLFSYQKEIQCKSHS